MLNLGRGATPTIVLTHDPDFIDRHNPPGQGKHARLQERAAKVPATIHHETRQQRRAAARAAAKKDTAS